MYYGGFPAGYQPYNGNLYGVQQQFTPQSTVSQYGSGQLQQAMTPPTIHAEIVQVDGDQAAEAYPVRVGATQMMMARDDSAIYIKTGLPNGYQLDVYQKKPQTQAKQGFNPDDYVRRDEIDSLVEACMSARVKEASSHESV